MSRPRPADRRLRTGRGASSVKVSRLLASLAAAAALLTVCLSARAALVERIVAVIGDRPVLWTELLHRAIATRVQIRMQARDPNLINVQEQEMYKELLQHMIDERLEEQQADRAHVTVTEDEIDRGVANIASQAQAQQGRSVTTSDVFDEVRRRGLSEQDFRDEIRRQILEGKLIELRVRPRVRVTDSDAHAAYQRWTQELRDQQPVDVRILALRVPTTWTKPQIEARTALAEELARRAREGEDFCQLVAQYSDDVSTKDTCGSHGAQPMANLLPPIQQALQTLKAGSISDPIPVAVGQDQVLVVLQPLGQPRVPPFDDVKSEMTQRALIDGLDRARKQWLEELRRNVYIDVRL
jgi:peptidyl-prolyl cis-trans isomerase SurA